MNRISAMIATATKGIEEKVASGAVTKAQIEKLDRTLDMGADEHARFQEVKSLAVADGTLSHEEGMTLYRLLGPTATNFNEQPLGTKVTLTKLFQELLGRMARA